MYRSIAVLSAALGGVSSAAVTKDYTGLFSAWKAEHGRSYASAQEESTAFAKFAANEDIITAHNSRGLSWTLGHNAFSDMTADEFFSTRLGYKPSKRATSGPKTVHVAQPDVALPDALDWVSAGKVTPIKDQAACGSCWAFSTTGSIEGAYSVATGTLLSLSEEDLVQCNSDTDDGCEGGLMDNAFEWVEKNGLALESAYPYTSGTGITGLCQEDKKAAPAVTITGFTDVPEGDEDALKSAVALGPVSIAVEADRNAFHMYKSGVLNNPLCGGKTLDHGVLLVGYGQDTSGILPLSYWKVKNYWGTTWGEDGYIRMAQGKNMCGLASQASYPTGAKAATNTSRTFAEAR